MLHRESGLYLGTMGCMVTRETNAYVRQYNARIRALRAERGLPSWAPGSRLPERRRLLELLSEALPVTTGEQLEVLGLRSLGYVPRDSDLVPVVVSRRLEDQGLLLLGSDVSARCRHVTAPSSRPGIAGRSSTGSGVPGSSRR